MPGVLSLSLTHSHTHRDFTWHLDNHSHTHPRAESSAQSLSSAIWARSQLVIGLSHEAKRPSQCWFNSTAQSVSLKLWLDSSERRRRVVMAMTDIAADDLDEMLREAEDVFSEDGRLTTGQNCVAWKQAWVYQWAAQQLLESSDWCGLFFCFDLWLQLWLGRW